MSYILDALKKAEAERTLGAVPDIHAQHIASASLATTAVWQRPWIWIALTAAVSVPAVLAWVQPWRPAPVILARAALPVTALPTPASRPTASIPPLAAATPAPSTDAQTNTDTAPKAALQKPAKQKARAEAARKSKAAVAAHAHQKPAPAATPARNEPTAVALHELPDQIQREIPQLRISGYIYSNNRADRSVLINKRLLRDGDPVATDLTLEKMTPTGMIFNYKGYRYRMSY